jgi:hypothetical protein
MSVTQSPTFATFSPNLRAEDDAANAWLRQVTLRLRREICWRWQQQGHLSIQQLGKQPLAQQQGQNGLVPDGSGSAPLPPMDDPLLASLDLSRYWVQKCQFFQTDPTAEYLSKQLAELSSASNSASDANIGDPEVRGSLTWVIATLKLEPVAAFALALGLSAALDPAIAPVVATCLNDVGATHPTLALAQQLWDVPTEVLAIADPTHPLWVYGLLQPGRAPAALHWQTPLTVPLAVARTLLFPHVGFSQGLTPLAAEPLVESALPDRARWVAYRLRAAQKSHLEILPLRSGASTGGGSGGGFGSKVAAVALGMAQISQRPLFSLQGLAQEADLKPWLTLAWLRGWDLFLPAGCLGGKTAEMLDGLLGLRAIPVTLYLELGDGRGETCSHTSLGQHLPPSLLLPLVEVSRSSYEQRRACWHQYLGDTDGCQLTEAIAECARRFRYEPEMIRQICDGLQQSTQPLTTADLIAACRAEVDLDMGELAQPVTPRFQENELILPAKQQALFAEVAKAMTSLTAVHYDWGTAQAWNECGISVLFAGPPGTGKTMAAEVLAHRLNLPMYRIDLSQVVNKYIGETEKNLKRLFDLADMSDTLLFFDEADALFGRRTEVKDAHDRYANLETSYLLERMERFKGLAILATNRKKDLDEAFLRRLRYIIDFPLPDVPERRRIWQQVMPPQVDSSQLDFEFLARQFPLAGGHIRSIVFNACLQAAPVQAANGISPQLTMAGVLVALKREYDKLNRSVSLEQFGPYSKFIQEIIYE